MKWMIASDLHGSALWTRRLLEAYRRESASRLILLGDLLYHGPRNDLPEEYDPKQVIALLNALKDDIFCVRGNCEAEVDQMVLEFPVMADLLLLALGERCVIATHGHLYNESRLPPMKPGDLLLHGHTHVSFCHVHDDYACLNPGSVSLPKENTPRGFILLGDGRFTWKTLDGRPYRTYDPEAKMLWES